MFDKPKIIEGLFAAGQAMGGLFGANRLGSTSLTELAVFGYRAGKSACDYLKKCNKTIEKNLFQKHLTYYNAMFNQKGKESAYKLKIEFQKECWDKIGPARSEIKLKKMLKAKD